MDIQKKLNEHNEKVISLNKGINHLINEQEDSVDYSGLSNAAEELYKLGVSMQSDMQTSSSDKEGISVVQLKFHDEIKFKDDEDTIIKGKASASFNVLNIENKPQETILSLSGEDNSLIPDHLILFITIPYKDGVKYKGGFDAELDQKNIKNNEEDGLGDMTMQIISYK